MRPLHDELSLIRLIRKTLGKPSRKVLVGIGDDAAVTLPPKGKMVATTDALVEGVHFDLSYMTARELGHKALAVNLSDIAAMGAKPLYALVSLGLKQELDEFFVLELYRGLGALAKRYGVDIIGGNLVQSPSAVLVDITAIGQVLKRPFTRSGARVHDLIAVTGKLGTSAAGLNCLKRIGRPALEGHPELLKSHLMPEPRLKEAAELQKSGAVTAMLDVSDGLAIDLHHLLNASNVGAFIDERRLPVSEETERAGNLVNADHKRWVLFGGEDYELLFTFDPRKTRAVERALQRAGSRLCIIGEVLPKSKGVRIRTSLGKEMALEPRGWNHFVRRVKPRTTEYV